MIRRWGAAGMAVTVCAGLVVAGAVPAAASSKPSVSLAVVRSKIGANHSPSFKVGFAHLQSGTNVYLQRQYGTAHVWKNVARITRNQTVTTAKLAMGKYGYRVRAVRKGSSVAYSPTRFVLAYGKISLASLCSAATGGYCNSGYETVGSSVFDYSMSTGSNYYNSGYEDEVSMSRTSCSRLTLRYASHFPADDSTYLRMLQASSDAQYSAVSPNTVGQASFALDGGSWVLGAATTDANQVYYAGSALCYTRNGAR